MTNPDVPKRLADARDRTTELFRRSVRSVEDATEPGEATEITSRAARWFAPRKLRRPPTPWAKPTPVMAGLTANDLTHVLQHLRDDVAALPPVVYTGFESCPEAGWHFTEGEVADFVYFAPLISECLDGTIYRGLLEVVTAATGKLSREEFPPLDGDPILDLYRGDDGLDLMRLANRFLELEAALWWLAKEHGFAGPVPYPVRYEASRYLWSHEIAGVAFCLRCGTEVRYQRAGRGDRIVPLCAHCLRGDIRTWPPHAVMPYDRGRWWLRCQRRGCKTAFIGRQQARFCSVHKAARTPPAKRRSRVNPPPRASRATR